MGRRIRSSVLVLAADRDRLWESSGRLHAIEHAVVRRHRPRHYRGATSVAACG